MGQHVVLSQITKDYIVTLADSGKRLDGRPFDAYRNIRIKVGHIQKAEGSAEVWLGNTRVLAGVKVQPGTPYPDQPTSGTLSTAAEMNPLAAPDYEAGPPRPEGIELARVVDRGVRESGVIKFDQLGIKDAEGKISKVWMVFLDLHILDYDGNLFDACSLAALGAVLSAKLPNTRYKIEGKTEDEPLPLSEPPISTTTVKIGKSLFSDPSLDEDLCLDARLTVACDQEGNIRAMQKGGYGSLSVDEVKSIINLSRTNGARIRQLLKQAVASGEARTQE
ncbi:MAG: exosome complex protein Rrp42 [Euryarchaeota archaeon]|nr:exosome complex protein Rrp42 [Euryarchaeota archaeon]